MDNFLSQEEIDALLKGSGSEETTANEVESDDLSGENLLNDIEKDALGEIGNISMGSAATALSQLLNQKVNITTPKVKIMPPQNLINTFEVPYMLVEVSFTDGLEGYNFLIVKVTDAAIMADLMMGGDGTKPNENLSEIELSAVSEAMNQMMGSAATSMSTMFSKHVNISPPQITSVDLTKDGMRFPWENSPSIVVVSFKMEIGTLINSEIHQVLLIPTAKKETSLLMGYSEEAPIDNIGNEAIEIPDFDDIGLPSGESMHNLIGAEASPVQDTPKEQKSVIPTDLPRNIDLILDVPLNISVVLGKTKRPIKEVLSLIPGSIVELEKVANEPVEILVNGTLIAHGEVVVVNESFGVRIISIDSPAQRLNNLKSS